MHVLRGVLVPHSSGHVGVLNIPGAQKEPIMEPGILPHPSAWTPEVQVPEWGLALPKPPFDRHGAVKPNHKCQECLRHPRGTQVAPTCSIPMWSNDSWLHHFFWDHMLFLFLGGGRGAADLKQMVFLRCVWGSSEYIQACASICYVISAVAGNRR